MTSETRPCMCGHSVEEHGGDPKYPGSTSCAAEGCDCIAYEADMEDADSINREVLQEQRQRY